jgi:hypothetical protein
VHDPAIARDSDVASGVEANSRLTAGAGGLLLLLLAAEGVTILSVRGMLGAHVFIGMLLVPPVLVKVGSTGLRFVRYYRGSADYRRKGPPPPLLRMLGPAVVVLTIAVLASGVALILAPHAVGGRLLSIHKVSFVLWFGVMAIHVLGHLVETARLAPADWIRRTRRDVAGAGKRQWLLAGSLVVGCGLGAVMLGPASTYRVHRGEHEIHAAPEVSRRVYPKLSVALMHGS